MTENKLPVPAAPEDGRVAGLPVPLVGGKYQISVSQKSGISSDALQNQNVFVGDQIHVVKDAAYKRLVAIHEGGITFDPVLLRDIIVTIDAGVKEIVDEPIDFATSISIDKKNKLNNHSDGYFEQYVELDFYPQFYKLDKFLGLKENQLTLQPKVDKIIQALSRQIHAFQGSVPFEAVLLNICTKLIDTHYEQLQGKENEILLVLYYFYCNCCIGKKTEEEKNAGS